MKLIVAGLLFTFAFSANAFDTNNFVKKYCSETKDSLICRNFVFTTAEKNDIQKTKFTISNAPRIEFLNSDIGSFNENLVNKFPNAVDMNIYRSTVHLNYSVSSISTNNAKLQKLSFEEPSFFNNANSLAFSKLTALKTIEIKNPTFIQYFNIDDVLLSKNTNLETVDIRGALFYSVTPKAFANLKKLTTLNIVGTNIDSLSDSLIKNNTALKELNLDSNRIRNIPMDGFFPNSLEKISLKFNHLRVVTNKTFSGLTRLKTLSLSNNQISIVSNNAFILPALENLHLDYNSIVDLERKHVSSCKNLKEILVNGNLFKKLPNDFLDDLTNIVNAVV